MHRLFAVDLQKLADDLHQMDGQLTVMRGQAMVLGIYPGSPFRKLLSASELLQEARLAIRRSSEAEG
jgi:hypothetical protein